ncbi:MAG: AzlC family ABC transporter permease [Syntrophales bacterium LBB04]|nr:AzlC family ABC transporter permease [Syntrophales bacterium LBB04]
MNTNNHLRHSPRSEFIAGVGAIMPILLGVVPFGMIYGVLAMGAGLTVGAAMAMSSIVFAGSAQCGGVQLIHSGAPGMVIVFTTFIVNLRHILYSASIAPYLARLNTRWKWLLAYLLTDEAYAVTITRYNQESSSPVISANRHWYLLGAGLAMWGTWQVSTAAGIFLGAQVPSSWSLDFTIALTFIALVVPALRDRPSVAAAISAGIIADLAFGLPYKLGLIVAAIGGMVIGLWVEARQPLCAHRHEGGDNQ